MREESINFSLLKLEKWLTDNNYTGFDPFDGLNANIRFLAFGKLGKQILQQSIRRFPHNMRPILGIKPSHSSKGFGFIARGYLKLYEISGENKYLEKSIYCLNWLLEHPSSNITGLAWGNHFDYQSRVFYLPQGKPTVVWTALIGFAFIDAWEILKDEKYYEAILNIAKFMLTDLSRKEYSYGTCIGYIPDGFHAVHNANALAAAFLARAYKVTKDNDFKMLSKELFSYTLHHQRQDGSWLYGEDKNLHWVDNFHTAYVLDSIYWYLDAFEDKKMEVAFTQGCKYYLEKFFTEEGIPKYYFNKIYPIDIQCVSQSIDTLSLINHSKKVQQVLNKVVSWSINNMQDADGHFYFRRWPMVVDKTPMLHWGQSTMFHALTHYLQKKEVIKHED